ncbi:-85 kDa calcium-independent phospholipase A2 [Babesia bigemina]|uniref:-85 kDa calcium-independent phospholipase A2 n=1 Tax=Babesia bigemina TaxID=5866 RepID=A0A061DE32_BABBI|nr:-85 kDa calcium-independent phospholipase A2 [Babesia bigemina]CDR97929.1 -85 kDa calcium-independent phospholipase A2 [Babesia bigemina]|eukprot:XP_012770115.1 -85 kDa calcium-independent phospholipase A2 [Babesia bigemina]
MVTKVSRKRLTSSLYDKLYMRHLDCVDHLCSGESSNVDTNSEYEEVYESACSANESSPPDSPQRLPAKEERADITQAIVYKPSKIVQRHSRVSPPTSEDEAAVEVDPFGRYSFGEAERKGRSSWKKNIVTAFTAYARTNRSNGYRGDNTEESENRPEVLYDMWADYMDSDDSSKNDENTIKGTVYGTDSEHVPLKKRGFYTIFLRNPKAAEKKTKQDIYLARVKFTYKIIDCNRKREEVRIQGNAPPESGTEVSFVPHDIFGDDSFCLTNEGSVTVAATTKIVLICASDDSIAEFSITHNPLNFNPSLLYKIVYGGWCSAVPLSITPKVRLRVLSLDSCENLGTTVLETLYTLETRISAIKGEPCNIADYFDVICATGSGALLALCLLKGYSAKELKLQWQSILSQLFKWPHSLAYGLIFDHLSSSQYAKVWIDILGTDFMCSKARPLCMLTSTQLKNKEQELFMFRNYTNTRGPYAKTALAPMWLAGWATTAMPTYIKGPTTAYLKEIGCKIDSEVQFADGKFVSVNPSLVALHEVGDLYGYTLRTLIDETLEIFLSLGSTRENGMQVKMRDSNTWQIVLNTGTTSDKIEQSHMTQLFEEHPEKYHRIHLPYVRGCKHGKTDKEWVDTTFAAAADYLQNNLSSSVDAIVEIINK